MQLVLASESPFRRRALDLIGVAYETCPCRIDEKAIRDDDPRRLTQQLAEAKARHIARQYPAAIIISGDAVAAKGRRIFEKPRDKREAALFSARTFRRRISIHHFAGGSEFADRPDAVCSGDSEHHVPPAD